MPISLRPRDTTDTIWVEILPTIKISYKYTTTVLRTIFEIHEQIGGDGATMLSKCGCYTRRRRLSIVAQ